MKCGTYHSEGNCVGSCPRLVLHEEARNRETHGCDYQYDVYHMERSLDLWGEEAVGEHVVGCLANGRVLDVGCSEQKSCGYDGSMEGSLIDDVLLSWAALECGRSRIYITT